MSSAMVRGATVDREAGVICVVWSDGMRTSYHGAWLRDHDPHAIHEITAQRQSDSLAMVSEDQGAACTPIDAWVGGELGGSVGSGNVAALAGFDKAEKVWVRWGSPMGLHDGEKAPTVTGFSVEWLKSYSQSASREDGSQTQDDCADAPSGAKLWGGPFDSPPSSDDILARAFDACEYMEDDAVLAAALTRLRTEGYCLIRRVETTKVGTSRAIERIGYMRRTLYSDGIWDTAPRDHDADLLDTAYTNMELKPHTDCTYYQDAPMLQFFNCERDSDDVEGGQTVLVDGFAVAASLQQTDPDVFQYFCRTPLPFHCITPGEHLEVMTPVFNIDPCTGRLRQFRLNNDDRAPIHPHKHSHVGDLDLFYRRYLPTLLARTRDPSFAAEVRLSPGTMLVINNHRVMHGRRAFKGSRRNMIGGYMNLDEFESRCRTLGLPTEFDVQLQD